MQNHVSHHLCTSAYSHAWSSLTQIIKGGSLPSFDWNLYNPPLRHPDGIKSFLTEKLCANKKYVCLYSAATALSLELMSFLCHPPQSMFIKFNSQGRPVLHNSRVLHFFIPGGGSSLQTCRWCSPFHDWEGHRRAGWACAVLHTQGSEAALLESPHLKRSRDWTRGLDLCF